MTRFVSVLGESAPYSFGDAVLAGWASDGGMLWPETIPRVSPATITLGAPSARRWRRDPQALHLADDSDFRTPRLTPVAGAFGRFGSADVVELSTPLQPPSPAIAACASPNCGTGRRSPSRTSGWRSSAACSATCSAAENNGSRCSSARRATRGRRRSRPCEGCPTSRFSCCTRCRATPRSRRCRSAR